MSKYAYAVKVRRFGPLHWIFHCPADPVFHVNDDRDRCLRWAHRHAAACEGLHRANLAAACACTSDGQPNPACPVCLGRGYEREREGLS